MIAAKFDMAVRDVCPIHGVSIGRKDDKTTWRIDFKDEATESQRAEAMRVKEKFDVATYEAEQAKTAQNAPILAQIEDIERKQLRAVREVAMGTGDLPASDGKTARQRCTEYETQITTLRSKLVK